MAITKGVIKWVREKPCSSFIYTDKVGVNRNADLIMVLKVKLIRYDPKPSTIDPATDGYRTVKDSDDKSVKVEPWGKLWSVWRNDFKRLNERQWNNKLWLVPSADWGCISHSRHRPNVKCGLKIELVETNPDLEVNCVRLAPGESYRSYVMGSKMFLDSKDLKSRGQLVTAHEFGHFLGLSHVNADGKGCPFLDKNAQICYGATRHQREDMMGAGNRIEKWHAWPWLQRTKKHVTKRNQALQWKATTRRPVPIFDRESPTYSISPIDRTR